MGNVSIAVDAMGGDYAPKEIIKGALKATQETKVNIILVGKKDEIERLLKEEAKGYLPVRVYHAPETVSMAESPFEALRNKKNTSIQLALELVKKGEAQAVFSAGNSGVILALAVLTLGRIRGVDRPALAGLIPTLKGKIVLIDVGAVVDCRSYHLVQFAVMGWVFAKYALSIPQPKVGLLNIGEEPLKGNDLVKETYSFLQKSPLNFIGNIEGEDILHHKADVVVCDGFVGNTTLKIGEGVVENLLTLLKLEGQKSPLAKMGLLLIKKELKQVIKRLDFSEYGGAPLLGINGTVIIGHGRSHAQAVKNGIKMGVTFVKQEVNAYLERGLKEYEEFMPSRYWRKFRERLKEVVS
jgi:glycerol-3-phosphate acyltransferase PlsX